MRTFTILSAVFFLLLPALSPAQNYLRVADPDQWGAPVSNQPDWYVSYPQGRFDEVTITVEPQGIFTEIGVYATISQGPDAWSWSNDYEIIWQFDLPENAIVHDAWLWVGQDIIKADIIDFWTALETYTGIVDYNQDPLFFYQMSDKRYEVRVYPLLDGESRRMKLTFLVPAAWQAQSVAQELLHTMLKSTTYFPSTVDLRMPVSDTWGTPMLTLDDETFPVTSIIQGGSGQPLHSIVVSGEAFAEAAKAHLVFDAPYSGTGDRSFARTYSDGGEQFYQLAYSPHWEDVVQASEQKKSLILLDYDPDKSSLSKATLKTLLRDVLSEHFTPADALNMAVVTSSGVQFLSGTWWDFDDAAFPAAFDALVDALDADDLPLLLTEGYAWAQAQGEVAQVYLMAANDDYVFPPYADDVFAGISQGISADIPLTVLDYHNTNISVIFYNGDEYEGNEYFYQLLAGSVTAFELLVYRDASPNFTNFCREAFAPTEPPTGFMDVSITLANGVCYHRHDLHNLEVGPESPGVIRQTGKYLGEFPIKVQAVLVTDDGQFWQLNDEVFPEAAPLGDTLMREMWYGMNMKWQETQISSNEDRQELIDLSIEERVLTGLTAFLALEPSLGGEPCIDCLYNDGGQIINTEEAFDTKKAEVLTTPNPAAEFAHILLRYPERLSPQDWSAEVYDVAGRLIAQLGSPSPLQGGLQWRWDIGGEVQSGVYFCKIKGKEAEVVGKVVVLR